MRTRFDIINAFIKARGYKSYLEIGCQNDDTFREIGVPIKVGVDPNSGGTVRATSDQYFDSILPSGVLFDVIFIDGDHRHPQVWRDVENALAVLHSNGVLFMHDCLPAHPEHESPNVNGTAWRAFVKLREQPDVDAYVANLDHGTGFARKKPNTAQILSGKTMDEMVYADLVSNKTAWMRPVNASSVFQFATSDW